MSVNSFNGQLNAEVMLSFSCGNESPHILKEMCNEKLQVWCVYVCMAIGYHEA